MGILDKVNNSENSSSENREEVTINPVPEEDNSKKDEETDNSRLKKQAQKELTGSGDITLEDVHRQNERIIGLLEELTGESSEDEEVESAGGLDGVL